MLGLISLLDIQSACGIDVPVTIANVVHLIVWAIQLVVPILLIIWGMLDFAKAVIAADEDKIKGAQKVFIKRLIVAVIVFLVVTIVKLLISLIGSVTADDTEYAGQTQNTWSCVSCFVDGPSSKRCN